MSKYSKGKIYTIRCINDDSKIYVGSTIQPLCKRFSDHRTKSNKEKYKNIKLYQEVQDWNDWYIELYENYNCNDKNELTKKEGEVIREIGTLNKVLPGRTQKERYETNKEKILEKRKEYYEDNKEKILEQKKQYHIDNKETNNEKAKQYRDNNKEKCKEYDKQYQKDNKEIINEKRKKKVVCDHCGSKIRKSDIAKHQKTKKCINFVKKD